MGLFGKKYYYLSAKKSDGSPIVYGALRNKGKNGELGKGSYCSSEAEAIKAANDLLRGKMYEIRTSKHSVLAEATKEWKANKLNETGDLDISTRRVSHKIEDKPKDDDDLDYGVPVEL